MGIIKYILVFFMIFLFFSCWKDSNVIKDNSNDKKIILNWVWEWWTAWGSSDWGGR